MATLKKPTELGTQLVLQLDALSQEGKSITNLSSSGASAQAIKERLINFGRMIRGMENLLANPPDSMAREVKEVILREGNNFEQQLSKFSDVLITKSTSHLVFPTVMSIAASIKYYISWSATHHNQLSQSNVAATSEADATLVNESKDQEDPEQLSPSVSHEDILDDAPRSRTQLTTDIFAFAKSCTRLSLYLKSQQQLERPVLLGQIASILHAIKKMMADENFAGAVGSDAFSQFIKLTKQIRDMQQQDKLDKAVTEKLVDTLMPLAAAVKQAAHAIRSNANDSESSIESNRNSRTSSRHDLGASVTKSQSIPELGSHRSNTDLAGSYASQLEQNRPLGFKHDLGHQKLYGSAESVNASPEFNTDPTLAMSIESLPGIQTNSRKQTRGAPFEIDTNIVKQAIFNAPSVSSPLSRSAVEMRPMAADLGDQPLAVSPEGPKTYTMKISHHESKLSLKSEIHSITPVAIDILGQGTEGKYAVVFEVGVNKLKTEGMITCRRSDKEIRDLLKTLASTGVVLPLLPSVTPNQPSSTEISVFLHGTRIVFNAINESQILLKNFSLVRFALEHAVNAHDTYEKTQTIPKVASKVGVETDALFFTTISPSSANRTSTFQMETKEDQVISPSTPTMSRAPRQSILGKLTRSSTTFRASSHDSVAVKSPAITEESAKTISSDMLSSGKSSRSSKILSFLGSNNETLSRSLKSLSLKPQARTSKLILERHRHAKKFETFIEDLVAKGGWRKVTEDSVSRSEDDKVVLVIKLQDGIPRHSAGTLNKIVEAILTDDPSTDSNSAECLLLTYRNIMKPQELLMKLIEKYRAAQGSDKSQADMVVAMQRDVIQMQVAVFMEKWVSLSWDDFDRDEKLQNGFNKFLEIIKGSKKITLMADQIMSVVEKKKTEVKEFKEFIAQKEAKAASVGIISNMGVANFMSFDPVLLAEQLTRIDYDLFQKIKALDCIEYIMSKERHQSPVDEAIARFNLVSFWVGTEICTTPLLKNRVAVLEQFIKLLKSLKDLCNFSSVMAVISGLNMASVRRLKKTWEAVNPKLINTLHEIEKLMTPESNYQSYRDYETRFIGEPFVPFIGLYLKDLTFANDGNPTMLDNGLINFTKNWSIYEIISRLMQFQKVQITFMEDQAIYEYCTRLIALPEKRLYNYSLLCEPRSAAASTTSGKSNKSDASGGSESGRLIEKWAK